MKKWWNSGDEYDLKDHKIYSEREFVIYECKRGYIIHNTNKPFEEGHTHLRHLQPAKNAIKYVINKKIPKETGLYYLVSLTRISDDENYIRKINELINTRKQKGKY